MRRIVLTFLLALPSLALDNSVTIHNWNGGGTGDSRKLNSTQQANRPTTYGRWFAKGEIPNYPRPFIDGMAATAWQADVKTRWNDGSVQFAILSLFTNINAGDEIVVDFRNSSNRSSAGDDSATDAAGLDKSGILNFNSGNWGACISVTAGAPTTYTVNARTMIGSNDFEYLLRGPVVTQVIVRDHTDFSYNMGWHWTGGIMNETATTTYKSLGPAFILSQYPGWNGVKVDYIMENTYVSRRQDQVYSLQLKSDSSCSTVEYSKSSFTHLQRSRYRKTFWDGAVPEDVRIDYNTAYMVYSKAVPSYDTSVKIADSVLSGIYSIYVASDKGDISGSAGFTDKPLGSDEPSITLMGNGNAEGTYGDYSILALTWDARAYDSIFGGGLYDPAAAAPGGGGLSAIMSHGPFHYYEDRISGAPDFCDYSCSGSNLNVTSVGRIFSIDAWNQRISDGVGSVGTTSNDGWGYQQAHYPDFHSFPYLLTGDYYYLTETQLAASAAVGQMNAATRLYNLGWADSSYQIRGQAHTLKLFLAAWLYSPDGSPEKEYFWKKLENNIAIREGTTNIKGNFGKDNYAAECASVSPTSTAQANRACVGYKGRGLSTLNTLHFPEQFYPYLTSAGSEGNCGDGRLDGTLVAGVGGGWMLQMFPYLILRLDELEFPLAGALAQAAAENMINRIIHPDVNPYAQFGHYRNPMTKHAEARKVIENISKSTNAVFTVTNHGYVTNDYVVVGCILSGGWTAANSAQAGDWSGNRITKLTDDTFQFQTARNTSSGSGADFASTGELAHVVKPGVDMTVGWFQNWRDWSLGSSRPNRNTVFSPTYAMWAVAPTAMAARYKISETMTGRRAFDWAQARVFPCPGCSATSFIGTRHLLQPRPVVTNIRRNGNILLFNAPDGSACTYAFSPQSTLDGGDVLIEAGNRTRSIDLTGHQGESLRLTCGTARSTYLVQ